MSCATWTSSACPKLGPSLTGYLAIAIRKFEIGIDTNPAGTKKGETTLSLSLDRARSRGEERKGRKRKEKKRKQRNVTWRIFVRLVENRPDGGRLHVGEHLGVVFPRKTCEKKRITIYGVDDGLRGDRLESEASFFFFSIARRTKC